MTFDTGLTLTVDNLVAKSVTNNGIITAHKLLPYDDHGLTIDHDNCTLTCADTGQDPRINIYPGLNCYGYITGSAGAAISGDFYLKNQILTPSLTNPIDLILKPSGDVRVFAGKTLYTDTISTTAGDLAIKSAMNQNISMTTPGTGAVFLSSVVTPAIAGLASGPVSVNTRANFQAGINTDTIKNQTAVGVTISTTDNTDITLNPTGKVQVAAGKTLTADIISSTSTTKALTIQPANNQNIVLYPTGSGVTNVTSNLFATNDIIISGKIDAANGSICLQATGTGQILCNKAFIVGTIGSPSGGDLVMAPSSEKFYVVGSILTSNIKNEEANGSLNLTANGTGTINLNSTAVASTITTSTNGNLLLSSNGTGQVQIASGRTFATDIIKSNGATAIAIKTNTTFDAGLTETVVNIVTKSIANTTTNGSLALAANGTGTINLNSPAVGSTITA